MNKYEKYYKMVEERKGRADWIDTAVATLAVDIAEETGLPAVVRGPVGLCAEVMIDVGRDDTRMLGKSITLTPNFPEEGGLQLYYDTGLTLTNYAPGSLGDFNGFNNDTARLPDTLPEIIKLLRDIFPKSISDQGENEMKAKAVIFDSFAARACPFFKPGIDGNGGYGCKHPEQEAEEDGESYCLCSCCPLGTEAEKDDIGNPNIDWDDLTPDPDCMEGEYLLLYFDPKEESQQKAAYERYQRYLSRYAGA